MQAIQEENVPMISWLTLVACLCDAEVQTRAAAAVQQGSDVVVQSETGSGKTLAFVLPLLARLQYPPEVYPDDLKVIVLLRTTLCNHRWCQHVYDTMQLAPQSSCYATVQQTAA